MASSPLVISAPTGWMPGDVLIDAVKKYPVLYDKRHERYKDNDFKEEIWKTIGSRFGVSGSKCQTKFKNLKDTYVKIRNQIKKSVKNGVGAGTVPNIKWKHFKTMLDIMEPMYDEKLNRLQISACHSFYLLVNNRSMANLSKTLSEVYAECHDEDGFLYVTYASQEMFGF
ncbi:transcription factor Adf-1 [Ixodes scapularis]